MKRNKFLCWKCEKTFTSTKDLSMEQVVTLFCSICGAENVVDLAPYRKKVKSVIRGENETGQSIGEELQLPEVIKNSRKPDNS